MTKKAAGTTCGNCGKELDPADNFCSRCGVRVARPEAEAAPARKKPKAGEGEWIIVTVAGNGKKGFAGDGGPAVEASLQFPFGVAFDTAGDLFIADTENHRVRRVDRASGTINTIAGIGKQPGRQEDGTPATEFHITSPTGLAFDSAGSLYIAAYNNHQVVRVGPAGTIALVAGDGTFPGEYGGDGGPATEARLCHPSGVAVDADGHLFIADSRNHAVRRVDRLTGTITTVAGTGTAGFGGDGGPATQAQLNEPANLAFDSAGHLYIADAENNRIRRVERGAGTITTVAGDGKHGFGGDGGPAAKARFKHPASLAFDPAGNLFVADTWNQRIRRIDAVTGVITTVAGSGKRGFSGDGKGAAAAKLGNPAVAVDAAGHLFLADSENHRIRKVSPG